MLGGIGTFVIRKISEDTGKYAAFLEQCHKLRAEMTN